MPVHDGTPQSTSGTCETIAESLPAYLYGDLPPEERSGIETHLETCAACKAALGEFRAVRDTLEAAPVPEMPSRGDLAAQVMARAQTAPPAPPSGPVVRPAPRRAAPAFSWARAAVILLAFAIGIPLLWNSANRNGEGGAVPLADIEGMIDGSADAPDVARVIDMWTGKRYGVRPLEDKVVPPIHTELFVYNDKEYRVLRDRAKEESTLLAGYIQLRLGEYYRLEAKDADLARAEYQKVFDFVSEGKVHELAMSRLDGLLPAAPEEK